MSEISSDKEDWRRGAPCPIRLAPLPCALVVFEGNRAQAGECVLPDGQVVSIRGPSQLRNDMLWVSNLSALEPVTHLFPNLRSDYYFRRKPADIAKDVAIADPNIAAPTAAVAGARRLSNMFTRVMTIAARAYGWDVYEMGPLRVREPYLFRDIGAGLPSEQPINADLSRALAQAYQPFSAPLSASYYWAADTVSITLRFNEVSYFNDLLSAPIPGRGKWHLVKNVEQHSNATLIEYCLSRPTVSRVTVDWNEVPEEVSSLAAFGMSGQAKGLQRRWVTQPELAWLCRLTKITINQFWVFDGKMESVALGWQLPELINRPQASLSYSAGLVAFNHFLAATQSNWDRHTRVPKCSVRAAWLMAYDRAMMAQLARAAHQEGFIVERYGLGSLKLRVPIDKLEKLEQFKTDQGFMYPDISWFKSEIESAQASSPGALRRRTPLVLDQLH